MISIFRPGSGFRGKGLGSAINMRHRAFARFQALSSNPVNFLRGLLAPLSGVMNSNLFTLFHAMKGILGSRSRVLSAVDCGSVEKVKRMPGVPSANFTTTV